MMINYKDSYGKRGQKDSVFCDYFYYPLLSVSYFYNERQKLFLKYFKDLEKRKGKNLNILDLGTGAGRALFGIKKRAKFPHNYFGVDINEVLIKSMMEFSDKNQFKNIFFLNIDLSKRGWGKKINKKFDLIIFSEVIEHMYPTTQNLVLKEVEYLLADNGLFIITCPNKSCLIKKILEVGQKIPILKTKIKKGGEFKGSEGHVAEPYYHQLRKITKNYKKIKQGGFTFSYGNEIIDDSSFLFFVLLILSSFFRTFFPFWCFDQYIILKKKK